MTSPARSSYQHKLAARLSAAAAPRALPSAATAPTASEYEMLLLQLGQHQQQLSEIQSVERKIEAKRTMVETYRPWVMGVLEGSRDAAAAYQDEIVTTIMVWLIDIGDIDTALLVAAHVLAHGLSLPERYQRTAATLVAEEIADAALKPDTAISRAQLVATAAIIERHDMPDQVRAKLHKAIARALCREIEAYDPDADGAANKGLMIEAALTEYRRALALNDAIGVKRDIELLEREQKKLVESGAEGAINPEAAAEQGR